MKFEIDNLNTKGYFVSKFTNDLSNLEKIGNKVKSLFLEGLNAAKNNSNVEKLDHFINNVARGSLDIDLDKELELEVLNLVKNSEIIKIGKEYWNVKKLFYSRKFSKFRYVDPNNIEQKSYSPLHFDAQFFEGKSINVCVPFTGYGGEYPGLDVYKRTNLDLLRKILHKLKFDYEKRTQEIVQKFCKKEEPEVNFGNCLCFTQDVYHKRTILNKNKIRINLEFRIFPDYDQDLISV